MIVLIGIVVLAVAILLVFLIMRNDPVGGGSIGSYYPTEGGMLVGAASPQTADTQASTQSKIQTQAVAANNSIIPPPTNPTAPAVVQNAGNILLATTSAASVPIFNTILQSELTFNQQQAIAKYTANSPIVATAGNPITLSAMAASLPASFDSRTRWPGLIGQPLDQLTCGSCWSFGTATAMGDRIRIFSKQGTNSTSLHLDQDTLDNSFYDETVLTNTGQGVLTDTISYRGTNNYLDTLSPYYFAGCNVCGYSFNLDPNIASIFTSRNLCGNCCSGSVVAAAHVWMLLNGIIAIGCDTSIVEYTCTAGNGCPVYRPKAVYQVNPYLNSQLTGGTAQMYQDNMQAIMMDLVANGPVVTSMYVYNNFATWPAGMVYDDTQGSDNEGGHCVVIIGYDNRANPQGVIKPCWIVRNSWAETWGDGGFFYILRGSNFCRIESDVHAGTPFSVYNTTKGPDTVDLSTLQVATSCSVAPSYGAVVNPG